MELRYCEECGDVIHVDSDQPLEPGEQYLCGPCGGSSPPAAASAPPTSNPLSANDLELFSQGTIALRKQQAAAAPETGVAPSSSEFPMAGNELELFSPETIAIKKQARQQAGAAAAKPTAPSKLRLVKPGERGDAPDDAAPGSDAGSAAPARAARKIVFRCLHCRSPLSVRPVTKMSRLHCPSCSETLFVTPAGKLLRANADVSQRSASAMKDAALIQNVEEQRSEPKRLSAFAEHELSADPNKTCFLTEEQTAPLGTAAESKANRPGAAPPTTDEGERRPPAPAPIPAPADPATGKATATSPPSPTRIESPSEIEEDWPNESDLLGTDDFDSLARAGGRGERPVIGAVAGLRAILVGAFLVVPLLAIAVLCASRASALQKDPEPESISVIDRLGEAVERGSFRLLGDDDA